MARGNNKKLSQPQQTSRPYANGGTSEHNRLDWVLQSQSQLGERIASLETNTENIQQSLNRIENAISENNGEVSKLKGILKWAAGAIVGGVVAFGFITNGQLGKISSVMEKLEEKELKKSNQTIKPD